MSRPASVGSALGLPPLDCPHGLQNDYNRLVGPAPRSRFLERIPHAAIFSHPDYRAE